MWQCSLLKVVFFLKQQMVNIKQCGNKKKKDSKNVKKQ